MTAITSGLPHVKAGKPAVIVERLNTEVNAILREPDVNWRMLDAGL